MLPSQQVYVMFYAGAINSVYFNPFHVLIRLLRAHARMCARACVYDVFGWIGYNIYLYIVVDQVGCPPLYFP